MEAISIATEDVLSKHAIRNALRYQTYVTHSRNNNKNNNNVSSSNSSSGSSNDNNSSSKSEGTHPLFFYLPFTAAHSPLQPLPRHLAKCLHIPHTLRRDFCGMVLGIDESLKNLTDYIYKYLPSHVDQHNNDDINHDNDYDIKMNSNINRTSADINNNNNDDNNNNGDDKTTKDRYSNTIMLVLSDNGGSPWFGGLNTPLRGTKGDLIMN